MNLSDATPSVCHTKHRFPRQCACFLALSVLLLASAVGAGQTPNPASDVPAIQAATPADVVHITVDRSVVLTSPAPLRRVYVGNPAVLQTFTSGTNQVVLTAKAAGVSSMVLWDESGGDRLYTVAADADPEALQASLRQAFPDVPLHAEAGGGGKIVLTGSVENEALSDAVFKMASLYTKDVVNSLHVIPVHKKQVQLKLRIIEVDRTRLDQLGVNIFAGGRTSIGTTTEQFNSAVTGSGSSIQVSNPLNLFLFNSKLDVGVTVRDLEQKQILQVLAEPTITTLSGLPARFLSGGEFPFPVVQGGTANSTAISVQFRPFGVEVAFTPTVNPDGSIRLKLSPEVSTLDFSNAVTISGFTIPALSTRRAETEVEILNGQSFVVSGLLDHRTTESLAKIPGIASIPVLGQLFRSKSINRSVAELVILVTASVVDPLDSTATTKPAEPTFVVPNLDTDAFDASARGKTATPAAPAGTAKP